MVCPFENFKLMAIDAILLFCDEVRSAKKGVCSRNLAVSWWFFSMKVLTAFRKVERSMNHRCEVRLALMEAERGEE